MNNLQQEKLRIALLRQGIEFMETVSDDSYLAFAETEKKWMAEVLSADEDTLKSFGIMSKLWPPKETS